MRKIFIVYIASFEDSSNDQKSDIHLLCRVQIAVLIANKALILIFMEYSDFADIFFLKLPSKLPKYIEINYHAIELVDD